MEIKNRIAGRIVKVEPKKRITNKKKKARRVARRRMYT
jgi:hypothetical protein|tara:strand:- start:518 stop:631 length:114 start_codon:yes stop_codon:yes gene_type:complete